MRERLTKINTVQELKAKKEKIYRKLEGNPKNVRFEDFCKALEIFGFKYRGGRGSHRVFTRKGIKEILTIQHVKCRAKVYQVRQFLKLVEKYNLLEE
ncbi:type II toxin-antitoxin system HicA family toxin [Candidatus Pyrohabitans sp.]